MYDRLSFRLYIGAKGIFFTILGICDPDAFLEVKLLKLVDVGLSKFSLVDLTLGSVELKKLIVCFWFFFTTPLTLNLI